MDHVNLQLASEMAYIEFCWANESSEKVLRHQCESELHPEFVAAVESDASAYCLISDMSVDANV